MKIRILFLIPSLVGGGAERALINLLNEIDYRIYDVDLVVVSYRGVYVNQIPPHVNCIPLFKNDTIVRGLAYLQKRFNFDVVFKLMMNLKVTRHYHTAISFIDSNFTDLLFFVSAEKKVAWVHTSYGSYNNYSKFFQKISYRTKLIERRYKRLDEIVFVSGDSKKEFIEIFGTYKCMPVIYNLFKHKIIYEKASSPSVLVDKKSDFAFIAVGSLYPVKGYDRLIRAAAILRKKYDFQIFILGEGFLQKELLNLISKFGLDEVVLLKGFTSNPYPEIKSADAFVMTSISEALPSALIEAMILGKPVVATRSSGCSEILNEGQYGLLAEQDDLSLAQCMEKIMVDHDLRKKLALSSLSRSEIFDEKAVIAQCEKIFNHAFTC